MMNVLIIQFSSIHNIVFDDQSVYEFYGENHLHSANGLFSGLGYAKAFGS